MVSAPKHISTSFVERQNLTLRMSQRRFTLYVAHYNLCRVHEALRITPAMQLGVMDHVWTISELVEAALRGVVTEAPQGRKVGRLTVIDGGTT